MKKNAQLGRKSPADINSEIFDKNLILPRQRVNKSIYIIYIIISNDSIF